MLSVLWRRFTGWSGFGLREEPERVYVAGMAIMLWLSDEEENTLARIMRAEDSRSKQETIVRAIRDKAARLTVERQGSEIPKARA